MYVYNALYKIENNKMSALGVACVCKGAEGGDAQGWGGAVEDNVAFQFSLGPAKTAVVLVITEEVCANTGAVCTYWW